MIYLFDSGVTFENNDCVEAYAVNQEPQDNVGHGTCMASVIKSINSSCKIYSIKIGNDKPKISTVLQCLNFVEQQETNGQDIILFNANFSSLLDISMFESKLKQLSKKYLIIVPAGNDASSVDLYSPARCSFVLTVGSLNKSKKITSVSNIDGTKKIDLWVVSTNTLAQDRDQNPVRLFGTSVAASIAAALSDLNGTKDIDSLRKLVTEYNDTIAFN